MTIDGVHTNERVWRREHIAHATHGLDHAGAILLRLGAQIVNVLVHDVAVRLGVFAPDLIENSGAADDITRLPDEEGEEMELPRRQVEAMACPQRLIAERVEHQVSGLQMGSAQAE